MGALRTRDQHTDGSKSEAHGRGDRVREPSLSGRIDQRDVVVGIERFEGRALRPKRAADDPSFVRSREALVAGPQAPRGDHLEQLPLAVQLVVQRDLGVHNAGEVRDQQVETRPFGVVK